MFDVRTSLVEQTKIACYNKNFFIRKYIFPHLCHDDVLIETFCHKRTNKDVFYLMSKNRSWPIKSSSQLRQPMRDVHVADTSLTYFQPSNKIFRTIFRTVPGNLKKCPESLLSEMVSL